jgi:hypothetical protein
VPNCGVAQVEALADAADAQTFVDQLGQQRALDASTWSVACGVH